MIILSRFYLPLFLVLFLTGACLSLTAQMDSSTNEINNSTYQEDFRQELTKYQIAAQQGDQNASNLLWYVYYTGYNGVKTDHYLAAKYALQAAQKGYSHSTYWLGHMYYCGEGVKKNDLEAIKYFEIAAKNDNTQAVRILECIRIEEQELAKFLPTH